MRCDRSSAGRKTRLALASLGLLLVLLAPLARPPVRAQMPPMADLTPAPLALPAEPPDAAAGLVIYGERCASCHGSLGRGDGSMRDRLPAPPPSLAHPEWARLARAAESYDVVTNGRIEQLMPPWGDALSLQERWDVIAGLWSFYATPERMVRGREVWQQDCASCHGERPGASAAEHPLPLGQAEFWMQRSLSDFESVLGPGSRAPAAHEASLGSSDARRADVAAYARGAFYQPLAFESLALGGAIEGRVVNGSSGVETVAGTRILAVPVGGPGDEILPTEPITTVAGEDGRFILRDLLWGPDMGYRMVASYQGADYFDSGLLRLQPDGSGRARAEVEMEVFASDPDLRLEARLGQIVVSAEPDRGRLSVAEAWVIRNATDRAKSGPDALEFDLPAGAVDVRFDDPRVQASLRVEEGMVRSSMPIPPGETDLLFSYGLPYGSASVELRRRLEHDTDRLEWIVLGDAISMDSPQLGEQQSETRGGSRVHRSSGEDLGAGTEIQLRIEGLPAPSGASFSLPLAPLPFEQRQLGLAALVLAGLTLVLALLPMASKRAGPSPVARRAGLRGERARLVARIADLDRARAEGRLTDEDHAKRRALLFDRALALARAERSQEES